MAPRIAPNPSEGDSRHSQKGGMTTVIVFAACLKGAIQETESRVAGERWK